ncbi:MAG: hypothetical protein WCW29_04325 [Candidatus Paceibacterota bacterium]|jgi:hypothetical protein
MNLTKEKRKSIANSENLVNIIGKQLRKKDSEVKDKVDLSKIAKDLSERRDKALSEEKK